MKRIHGTDLHVPDGETHLLETARKTGRPAWKDYQHDRLEAAFDHVTHWDTAIDIGAHVGLLTCEMAKKFKRVVAFEPDPEAFACLRANTDHLPNVECSLLALGETDGEVRLDEVTDGNTGNRQIIPTGAVSTSGLHAFLRAFDDLEIHPVDFIKIDVQGYEGKVLRGAASSIIAYGPTILVEEEPPGKLRRQLDEEGAASRLLGSFGAVRRDRIGADRVYAFGPDGPLPYPKYADRGDYHWQQYYSGKTKPMVDEVCNYILGQNHKSIIDLGCGDGLYTVKLGAVGIDSDQMAIFHAHSHGAECRQLNIFRASSLDQCFDAVCMFDVFEHLHLQERVLQICRKLAPVLYILNPEPIGSRYHTREFTVAQLAEFCTLRCWRVVNTLDFPMTARNHKTLLHLEDALR